MVVEDGEFTGSRSRTIFRPVPENGPFYSLGRLLDNILLQESRASTKKFKCMIHIKYLFYSLSYMKILNPKV